jgi:hypothetical protein
MCWLPLMMQMPARREVGILRPRQEDAVTTTEDVQAAESTGPGGFADRSEYGPMVLANWLGLAHWQFEYARADDLIPAPDKTNGKWSHAAAEMFAERRAEILDRVGTEHPIGARRAAEKMAERTGLDVQAWDVETLVERKLLTAVDEYKGYDLYPVRALERVPAELLAELVDERQAWFAVSVPAWDAAEHVGWRREEFDRVARERGLKPGPCKRYARVELDALAGDSELNEKIRGDRLLGPDQAAAHLELRRTDWDYVVSAGWATHFTIAQSKVGRYRTVDVPLYRTADVEAVLDVPGVDWEEVRAVRPGKPSVLREYAKIPPTRAQIIRSWVAELGHRYGIEVWAWYSGGPDVWSVDWELLDDGTPTLEQVRAELVAHPPVAQYAGCIELSCEAGAAVRWARAMLEPGAAVILDTETTDLDGVAIELAVIDACTGATLLNTLVDPAGAEISAGAYAVHGISSDALVGAPSWRQVLPKLRKVTRGKAILAYNADFDASVIRRTTARAGARLQLQHLGEASSWGCIMDRRSDWARVHRWLPLGGGHRALGDCHSAREVLQAMTAP